MAVEIGVNSYGNESGLQTYATLRGVNITGDQTTILIQAMDYIEAQSFFGYKYDTYQDLSFPRSINLTDDVFGNVPKDIITAQYVAALLIDSGEVLNPTVEPSVQKEKVDVVEIWYKDIGNNVNHYPQVDMLLAPYVNSTGSSFKVSR